MRLPPRPPSQGNCSRQGETRCRPRSFFPPRSARETEEMDTRELMTPRALRGMAVNDVGRARISMMVRSMSSNSRPDTLVQDRTPQPHRFFLQRTAGPYIGVKRFQTIRRCSVDVAHGLVLLFGIGTKALPSWDSRTRWSNLWGGLAVRRTAGPSGHANSPHPSSREGHHSTARWSSSFLLLGLIRGGLHVAATSRQPRCDA